MNSYSDQTSAEVAQEAESERAGLVNTLDQLRQNLRPENMVDEMFSQAQAGSDLMDRVWTVARANPIPATLIGLGAAMLAGAGRQLKATPTSHASAWRARDDGDMSPLGVDGLNDNRGFAMDHYPVRSRTGLSRVLDDQPLILAALGIAVGAAIGSAIRSTDVEAQLMGDASESVRRNASALAREQLSQLRSTATQTLDQMKATAAEHGVSPENVSGLVKDLGDDVRTAALSARREGTSAPH